MIWNQFCLSLWVLFWCCCHCLRYKKLGLSKSNANSLNVKTFWSNMWHYKLFTTIMNYYETPFTWTHRKEVLARIKENTFCTKWTYLYIQGMFLNLCFDMFLKSYIQKLFTNKSWRIEKKPRKIKCKKVLVKSY